MTRVISKCGKYRYALGLNATDRSKSQYPRPLGFVTLHPPSPDSEADDEVPAACLRYADAAGYNGVIIASVYALRTDDTEELRTHPDATGPANARALAKLGQTADAVVFAWGREFSPPQARFALHSLYASLPVGRSLRHYCVGVSGTGSTVLPQDGMARGELWPYPPAFWHHSESGCVLVGSHADHAEAKRNYANNCDSISAEQYLKLQRQYDEE